MNNSSTFTTGVGCNILHCVFSTEERYAIIVSLLIIAVVSLVGNVLVCYAFLVGNEKTSSTLTLSNFHLAIANLLLTMFCVPTITIYIYIMGEWILGHVMCKLVAFVQDASIVASLLHLLVVTAEKYMAVCFPFTFRRKCKLAYRYGLTLVWLIAIGESAYYIQFKKLKTFGGKDYCMEDWQSNEKTLRIIVWAKTLFYFLTLLAIMILLGVTIFELRFGKGNFRPELTNGRDSCGSSWCRKRSRQARAVKILVVMLLSVLVCWSPFHSLTILDVTDRTEDISPRVLNIVYTVSLALFFAVCTIHPIIFLFINQKGRELVHNWLRKRFCSTTSGTTRRRRNSSALESAKISLRDTGSPLARSVSNRVAVCESRL